MVEFQIFEIWESKNLFFWKMKTLFPPNPPNPTEFICTHQRLWKLRGHVADLSWTSSDHFWKLSFSDFRTHFCSVSMHLKIWAKMQHICPTSQPSALLMSTRCHPISVRRLRRKSVGTLRTCPDLPPTISENFHFRFFGHIFVEKWSVVRFWHILPWNVRFRHLHLLQKKVTSHVTIVFRKNKISSGLESNCTFFVLKANFQSQVS